MGSSPHSSIGPHDGDAVPEAFEPSIQASLDGILCDLERLHELWAAGRTDDGAVDAVVGRMTELENELAARRTA